MTVELQESTKASEIIALASSGEEVVITREGTVLGKFTAAPQTPEALSEHGTKRFSYLASTGEVKYSDSFEDAPRVTAEQASKRLGFLKGKGYRIPDDIKTPFKEQIDEMFFGNPDKFK